MKSLLTAVIALGAAAAALAQAPPVNARYYVFDVGVVTGDLTPFRVNADGTMIWNSGGRAFVYRNCESKDLGHLGGGQSVALGINSHGVVVGKSRRADGRMRAFRYANGTMHDLGGGASSPLLFEEATSINFWGDVVGIESVEGTLSPTGVRYLGGVASPMARILITPPSGFAFPTHVTEINDSRYVAARIDGPGTVTAIRSTNFGHLWTIVQGVPGLEFATFPFAMNRYGHIVGIAGNGFTRAFISRSPDEPAIDLGTLGGMLSGASGINSYGHVVGWAERTSGGGPRAFMHDGTQMTDLNDRLWNGAGWLLVEATGINDAGQIVGFGVRNNQQRAFLLQPMARPPIFIDPCRRLVGKIPTEVFEAQ